MPVEESRWRNLAPASKGPASSEQVSEKDSDEAPSGNRKRRRQLVNSACTSCQRRKRQCNGERPRCGYCRARNLACEYTVPQGVSRSTFYVQRTRELESKVGDLERLITALQSGTDEAATSLLAQMRIGAQTQDLLRAAGLTEQSSPSQPSLDGYAAQPATNHIGNGVHDRDGDGDVAQIEEFLIPIFDRLGFTIIEAVPDDQDRTQSSRTGHGVAQRATTTFEVDDISRRPALTNSSMNAALQVSNPWRMAQVKRQFVEPVLMNSTRLENNFVMASPNLASNFGNMSFSSAVLSNHYPEAVQSQQMGNLFVQRWAMLTPTHEYTGDIPNAAPNSWGSIREESQEKMRNGATLEDICGVHPYMDALLDNESFMQSPKLSQWAAQSVYSIKRRAQPRMTEFASMYIFWLMMRWMIQPSPETFEAIPIWLRPTPTQLFIPHAQAWDFLVWPAFRSLLAERPDLGFVNLSWALDMSLSIAFNWPKSVEEGLCRSPITGQLDLSPDAKELFKDLTAWSVGPSFRQHVLNADAYVRIKYEDEE